MTSWVTDDVWQQLDPAAGRVRRPVRNRIVAVIAAATVVAVVVALGFVSGLFRPDVWIQVRAVQFHPHHTFTETIEFHNDGWFDERLLSVTAVNKGLRAHLQEPITASAGSDPLLVAVDFRITDCAAAKRLDRDPVIRLNLDRTWGTVSTQRQTGPIYPGVVVVPELPRAALFMDGVLPHACGQA